MKSQNIGSLIRYLTAKWWDILFTDLIRMPSCVARWFYHLKIKKNIRDFHIEDSSGKKAILYQQGHWDSKKQETKATLILHGLYSHPCVMSHLAKLAQDMHAGPVFSLYLTYDENHELSHRSLIKQALDTIEKMAVNHSVSLKGVVLVGHSMGGIEAAHTAFVTQDKRILSVISIAGRLKVVESLYSPCKPSLKGSLDEIYTKVQSLKLIPLYQIVGKHDWNAPLEATLIRHNPSCAHIVDAMHFNILFHRDMYTKFPEFLTKSLTNPQAPFL